MRWACWPRDSSISPPAGEIRAAKSARVLRGEAAADRTAAGLLASDFLTNASSGNELNSVTKLTLPI